MSLRQFLTTEISQLYASGQVAEPNTWISSYSVNKNGKRYTYYRLMKADPDKSKKGKVRGKMVEYLGSAKSAAYKQMKLAIARRNQIQAMKRQLKRLEAAEQLSGGQFQAQQQPPLTTWVQELQQQVILLLEKVEAMAKELEMLHRHEDMGRSGAKTASS